MKKKQYTILLVSYAQTQKAGSFENKNFNFTIEFLKGISDILYSYLNSCVIYYKSIEMKGGKNE